MRVRSEGIRVQGLGLKGLGFGEKRLGFRVCVESFGSLGFSGFELST